MSALPFHPETLPEDQQPAAPGASTLPTVLIVESSSLELSGLPELSQLDELHVLSESDTHRALRQVAANEPEVVISRPDLGAMDGEQFLEAVKVLAPDSIRMLVCDVESRGEPAAGKVDWETVTHPGTAQDRARLVETVCAAARRARRLIAERLHRKELERQCFDLLPALEASSQVLTDPRFCDEATGLANLALLEGKLNSHILTDPDLRFHVVAVGLEGWFECRGTHGQARASQILKQIAIEIGACLGPRDLLARVGEDTLAVILADAPDTQAAGRQIRDAVSHARADASPPANLDCVLGVSHFPADGENAEAVIVAAQLALQKARKVQVSRIDFDRALRDQLDDPAQLQYRLREAVEQDAFELHFQPRIRSADGALVGAEALLRWHDHDFGMVPAERFVPLLEATGQIKRVGRWVIEEASRVLARWRLAGLEQLQLSVNVSSLQLRLDDISTAIAHARTLAGEQSNDRRLEVEISESLLLSDSKRMYDNLARLRRRQVSVAVDGFGAGYASPGYLITMPLDIVKIDPRFLRGLGTDDAARAEAESVIRAIVDMSHGLRMRVIAKGVETPVQREILERLGCDELQGFLLGGPCAEAEFLERYAGRRARRTG